MVYLITKTGFEKHAENSFLYIGSFPTQTKFITPLTIVTFHFFHQNKEMGKMYIYFSDVWIFGVIHTNLQLAILECHCRHTEHAGLQCMA